MQVSQDLTGVTAADFNSDPAVSSSFTQSVAEAMGVDDSSVEILGVTESNSSSRRLGLLGLRLSSSVTSLTSSSSSSSPPELSRRLGTVKLTVDYAVVLVMQSLGYQDADEAVSQLRQSIEDSVSTGQFTEILKTVSTSNAVTVLANVKADQVTVKQVVLSYNSAPPSLFPTSQPSVHHKRSSSDSESGLSGGGLIGVIVAAAVVWLLIISFLGFYLYSTKKLASQIIPVQAAESNFIFPPADAVIEGPNEENL
jgi:hypothetical protein